MSMPDMQCTWWLDGIPVWLGGTAQEWIRCCQQHDIVPKSPEGDAALGLCVQATDAMLFNVINISPVMGWIMQVGVETLGVVFVAVTGCITALRTARKNRK